MSAQSKIENEFIAAINSQDFKVNVEAIAYALIVTGNDSNRIDFEDLIHEYLENARLEVVLETFNPFENECFEQLFKQETKEEALTEFLKFASVDGLSDAQYEITKKLSEEEFFDISYALAINDKKNLFCDLNAEYVKNKMKFEDIKLLVCSFDENIQDKIDTRKVNIETKVFAEFARKSTSQAGLVVAYRNYEFAVDCVIKNVDIDKEIENLKKNPKITYEDMRKICDKLSGNKKEISLTDFANKEHVIQDNIYKSREVSWWRDNTKVPKMKM
ncbi:hypothetical protein [Pseudomonas extremaustralis]